MTKEELGKATGQELVEQRDYCGVDGYYGDYLDNVNTEMLKRFNRLTELEKENNDLKTLVAEGDCLIDNCREMSNKIAELEAQIEKMKCCENCKQRELIREHGQWKERFNCKGNGCVCHSKWEIKENG